MEGTASDHIACSLVIVLLLLLLSGCLDKTSDKSLITSDPNLSTYETLAIYTEEQPPFNYLNNEGQISGRSTEIVQEIMKRLGVDYPIHMEPWADGYRTVLTTPNTAIYSTIMTHEREPMFKWVGPISEVEYSFFTCSDNPRIINSIGDLRKYGKVAVVKSDAREQYLQAFNFDNALPLADDVACIKALSSGDAEFWLGTKDIYAQNAKRTMWENIPDLKRLELTILSQRVYVAFHPDTPDSVIAAWQKELDGMKADGTYDLIQNRYMPYICSWVRCTP